MIAFPTSPMDLETSPASPAASGGGGPEGSGPHPPAVPPQALFPVPADTEALGDEIARVAAHIHAATYHLLVLIRVFDEREGWGWGFKSCAHWLSWRTGISPGPAREKVRVARALASLPLISGAMARGELSYSKVRALTRVATPGNEEELLKIARQGTAAHLEKLVRYWRLVDRLEDADTEAIRHERRFLRIYPAEDGSWELRGRLDPEVGALLQKALDWAGEALYRGNDGLQEKEEIPHGKEGASHCQDEAGEGSEVAPTGEQRRADAMGLLAERALAGGTDSPASRSDRFQVVVHLDAGGVSAETSAGADTSTGSAESAESAESAAAPPAAEGEGEGADAGPGGPTEDVGDRRQRGGKRWSPASEVRIPLAPQLPSETSRRLACDASVVPMLSDLKGTVLDVGRKRRTVPPALRRALERRDGGCRFPGCGCRYTDAHHITHWADGGRTRLDNLILLCRRHHRAVHEAGMKVEMSPDGLGVEFHLPDGRHIPMVPACPVLPTDPFRSLEEAHLGRGIDPDPWTPTPGWFGEPLDHGLAIETLRSARRPIGDLA